MIKKAFLLISKKNVIWLVIPIVLSAIVLPFFFKKDLIIYPGTLDLELNNYNNTILPGNKGGTLIRSFDTTNTIKSYTDILYKTGSGKIYPSAGQQWIVKPHDHWIDIRGYDHLTFKMASLPIEKALIITLQFFVDNFSKIDDHLTWQYLRDEFTVDKGYNKPYSIPLKELQTPTWWYWQFKKPESDFRAIDFSKLGMISLEDGSGVADIQKNFAIDSLYFEKKQSYILVSLLLSILTLYYCAFFGIRWILQSLKIRNKPVIISYEKLQIDNDPVSEGQIIYDFLGNNYSNPMLSLSFTSNKIAVPGNKISATIKDKYELSFRQYLNKIRITEAKRLLLETKLQISQIGYKVGYSNLTHFCRTFKEVTGISPNSFRQESNRLPTSPERTLNSELVK